MAEYHGRAGWISVFLERNQRTIIKLNGVFPMHLWAGSVS